MDQDTPTILLKCLSYGSETAKAEQLAQIPPEEWQRIAALAQLHAVAPVLYHHIKHLGVAIPADVEEELRQESLKNSVRNLRLYRDLGKVLQILRENNIPVIVLKGAYLAERMYANRSLRIMADVDLLVRKSDLLRVKLALIGMGCTAEDDEIVTGLENKHFTYRLPGSDFHFEIHWALFAPNEPIKIEVEGLWNRAQAVAVAQVPVMALSFEDLLLYHMFVMRSIFVMRISMIYDIGEVVRRHGTELDWDWIGARAQEWGCQRSVYVILRLAKELLGVTVPADWLRSNRPEGFEERYLQLARQEMFTSSLDDNIISSRNISRLWDLKGFGRKLGLILNRLLPSRASMARMYPAPAKSLRISLYYPVRWIDLLRRHTSLFLRMAHGDQKTQSAANVSNQIIALSEWLSAG
jgi:hypothetical protein